MDTHYRSRDSEFRHSRPRDTNSKYSKPQDQNSKPRETHSRSSHSHYQSRAHKNSFNEGSRIDEESSYAPSEHQSIPVSQRRASKTGSNAPKSKRRNSRKPRNSRKRSKNGKGKKPKKKEFLPPPTSEKEEVHERKLKSSMKHRKTRGMSRTNRSPSRKNAKSNKDLRNSKLREAVYRINLLLEDAREIEEYKIELASRFDFLTGELFDIIDTEGEGLINAETLNTFLKSARINSDPEQGNALLYRFDKNEDGFLDFEEFEKMFTPYTEEYSKTLAERKGRGVQTYADYTLQTRKAVKVVLKALIENLEKLQSGSTEPTEEGEEEGEEEHQNGNNSRTNDLEFIQESIAELYEKLQAEYGDDEITMNDIADELAEYGLDATFREFCVLFGDLDLSLSGKLNPEEYKEEVQPQKESNDSEGEEEENSEENGEEEHIGEEEQPFAEKEKEEKQD